MIIAATFGNGDQMMNLYEVFPDIAIYLFKAHFAYLATISVFIQTQFSSMPVSFISNPSGFILGTFIKILYIILLLMEITFLRLIIFYPQSVFFSEILRIPHGRRPTGKALWSSQNVFIPFNSTRKKEQFPKVKLFLVKAFKRGHKISTNKLWQVFLSCKHDRIQLVTGNALPSPKIFPELFVFA